MKVYSAIKENIRVLLFFLSTMILFFSSVKADAAITWGKAYGSVGTYHQSQFTRSIEQTSDGGYIGVSSGFPQTFVFKLDLRGNITWQKAYEFSTAYYGVFSRQTSDGGYILASRDGKWLSDVWIVKLDSNGNFQWGKTYESGGQDSVGAIQQTADGGYIVAGDSRHSYLYGPWIMKLDSNGNIQWHNSLGTDDDAILSVQQTSDGGYIAAGFYNWDRGASGWLLKFDSSGNVQWQKAYGHNLGKGGHDYFTSIQQTSDDGYVATGTSFLYGIWTVKFDSSGNIKWQKGYGGAWAESVQQTSNGGYIVVGNWDARILKLDINGNIEWYKAYGYSDYHSLSSVQQTSDGGYITGGSIVGVINAGNILVLKTDSSGNVSGCGKDLDRTEINTNATQRYTNEQVINTYLSVQPFSAVPADTSLISMDICFSKNNPPVANAGPDQTIQLQSCSGITATPVTLDGSASYDPDSDALTYKWTWVGGSAEGVNPTINLPYGKTTVTLAVDDGKGGTSSDTVDISIVDTAVPTLNVTVNPNILWPPNHKYVKVLPSLAVNDACVETTKVEFVSATSNEPDNGLGDGDTDNDIVINADGSILLRAERSGRGDGRIYTITYRATDAAGNSTTASATVTVPHNK